MNESPHNTPCIEMKPAFRPPMELTVAEYDERHRKLSAVERPRDWVPGAPPVEAVLRAYEAPEGCVRVFDLEAYDVQMRRLLGII